jgi:hypothetical protein
LITADYVTELVGPGLRHKAEGLVRTKALMCGGAPLPFVLLSIMTKQAIQADPAKQSKYQRYRASQKNKGMKLLRIWVPDVNAPGFKEEAERQAARLRDAAEEKEALEFIEGHLAEFLKNEPHEAD